MISKEPVEKFAAIENITMSEIVIENKNFIFEKTKKPFINNLTKILTIGKNKEKIDFFQEIICAVFKTVFEIKKSKTNCK